MFSHRRVRTCNRYDRAGRFQSVWFPYAEAISGADRTRFSMVDQSFLLKMAALVLAIVFNYTIHRQALFRDLSPCLSPKLLFVMRKSRRTLQNG
jgi:hypothetical protein